jgi:hypothetical protein
MEFDDASKLQILLAALSERYTSIHNIRARVENTGLWALGILLGVGGWLIQANIVLSWPQKAIYAVGILAAVLIVRLFYLADLQAGFRGQQRAASRIETILGLYKSGAFDSTNDPVFPASWESAGTHKSDGKFFRTTYHLLYVGTAFVLVAILISGWPAI